MGPPLNKDAGTRIRRKTKIICTLGPATDADGVLRRLFTSGMDVARLNFSHGNYAEHKKRVDQFKQIRHELKVPAGLILDTRGPEIRIGRFANQEVELANGVRFIFTTEPVIGSNTMVSVDCAGFGDMVKVGDMLLLDDGLIAMRVAGKQGAEVACEVVNGGVLSNNKKINIPAGTAGLPFMSPKDRDDIRFGVENDFDFIAASFVRNADDVKELRGQLREYDGEFIKVISKIECRDGVNNIDDILRASDGIMVARGDMGVEIPFEELPAIQKSIIRKCYFSGKTVITATQMLDSMIRNPRPTRAEITDVANAIYDGTIAVMLSGETAAGNFPVESLQTMAKIAVETERDIDYVKNFSDTHVEVPRNVTGAISRATCETAHSLNASAIISVTKSGHTAAMVSKYRPACAIIAPVVSEKVYNQLSLSWGVCPVLTELQRSTDEIFINAAGKASESGLVKTGDLVVITGGTLVDASGTTNTIRVQIIGDVLITGTGNAHPSSSGAVCVVTEAGDMQNFNRGEILVIKRSSEEIIQALKYAVGLITEEKMDDSKAYMATLAMGIPAIAGAAQATSKLRSGIVVTLDATNGRVLNGAPVHSPD